MFSLKLIHIFIIFGSMSLSLYCFGRISDNKIPPPIESEDIFQESFEEGSEETDLSIDDSLDEGPSEKVEASSNDSELTDEFNFLEKGLDDDNRYFEGQVQKAEDNILNDQVAGDGEITYVEIEPDYLIPSDSRGGFTLVPYKLRREKWGVTTGVGYGLFEPINYDPDLAPVWTNFEDIYGSNQAGLIEFEVNIKRNFSVLSIGLDIAVGQYSISSSGTYDGYTLSLTMARVGLRVALETLSYEPYIVPYGSVGGYITFFKEDIATTSFNGNTLVAPYLLGGVLFQLDWMDQRAADIAFDEGGIENTFLFLEARKYLASSEQKDPDFETEIFPAAGLKLEF